MQLRVMICKNARWLFFVCYIIELVITEKRFTMLNGLYDKF